MHLIVTDSGVGGLSVCAEIERRLREADTPARITYFNAWPSPTAGYNDLPEMTERAATMDRALTGMMALHPDRIVIACNTLSIVYGHTAFSRAARVPVDGIIDAGVALFDDALRRNTASPLVLVGTRTTIESKVHRDRLLALGTDPGRMAAVACHGLAAAIETDPAGERVGALIEECMTRAAEAAASGEPLLLGLCCTHYTYVRGRLQSALADQAGRRVRTLDPNCRLAETVAGRVSAAGATGRGIEISLLSKVELADRKRHMIAQQVESVSPRTAAALLSYTHVPELF